MTISSTERAITAETICDRLRELLPKIQTEYQIEELALFGSYVRGEATDTSDIDILVKFHPDISFGLIGYCHLENYLSEQLGKKVDLVMKDSLKPHIGANILREAIYL